MTGLSDSFQRPINYLRISVTDRCNLRCVYCMPDGGVPCIDHAEILTFEEIIRVVRAAADLGITKVRLTGGEPLVRAGLPELIRLISEIKTIEDIALTSNGIMLAKLAPELKSSGLRRVNISLDSMNPERFRAITRGSGEVADVLEGIAKAREAGLEPVKINMVVMKGINDDEIVDFARKTVSDGWNVRFIELMPFTGKGTDDPRFISAYDIKKRLDAIGKLDRAAMPVGNGPAKYYRFPGASGTVGFITPVTEHFCVSCNRLRLTSDGKLMPCLMSEKEIDLKQSLRSGAGLEELKKIIEFAVASKPQHHTLVENKDRQNRRPMSHVGG